MTSPESLVGQALAGVYILEEAIATGSTSMVFRATNRRLDQQVAVKVLFGSFTNNASLMARFEAEAKVQAKLNHPHIIRVFDFVADGGSYAIVMELVEGMALDQILYDLGGPMSLGRIKAMMRPVLDALSYAHGHGIVHRDIKPSNIIVSQVGRSEFPKVMDFGIAKVLAEGPSNTAPGAMLGTLLFMSPEQCKALKSVDARADIYSVGVTLYQMATGMVPFYAESAFEIMLAHVQTPPTPPKEFVPGLPDAMQALILRCLAKDPGARYANVDQLAEALDAVPESEGAGVPSPAGVLVATPSPGAKSLPAPSPAPTLMKAASSVEGLGERARQRLLVRDDVALPSLDAAVGTRVMRPRTRDALEQITGPQEPDVKVEARPRSPSGDDAQQADARSSVRSTHEVSGLKKKPIDPRAEPGGRRRALEHFRTGPEQPLTSRGARRAKPQRGGAVERTGSRMIERPFMSGARRLAKSVVRRSAQPTAATSVPRSLRDSPTDVLSTSYGAAPKRLRLRVANRDDWARYYDPNISGGGIFCPSADPPEVGAVVRVEITFVSGPRFFVQGVVTWRRPKLNDPRARAGVGVQVYTSERNKIVYVNNWANGVADDKRGLRRLPVKLRVTYSGRAGRRINFTRDLNEEGIFVRSRELLELDTPVRLLLMPPGNHKPFALEGVVSRLVEDSDDRGMGIRLRFSDSTTETAYASLVEQLEEQFLSGDLPDDALA